MIPPAGSIPFRISSIDELTQLDDSTPIAQRSGTGLALAGAPPFVIFKGWGFRFQYDRECKGGGSEHPHPCPPRRTRMGHPQDQNHSKAGANRSSLFQRNFLDGRRII